MRFSTQLARKGVGQFWSLCWRTRGYIEIERAKARGRKRTKGSWNTHVDFWQIINPDRKSIRLRSMDRECSISYRIIQKTEMDQQPDSKWDSHTPRNSSAICDRFNYDMASSTSLVENGSTS